MNAKRFFLLCTLTVAFSVGAVAQEKGLPSFYFGVDQSIAPINESNDFRPYNATLAISYNITSNFYAEAIYSPMSIALFDISGEQSYYITEKLGAGIGYYVVKIQEQETETLINNINLALELSASSSLHKEDWRFLCISGGVRLNMGRFTKLSVGMGFVYYHSYNPVFENRQTIYFSVGIRIN